MKTTALMRTSGVLLLGRFRAATTEAKALYNFNLAIIVVHSSFHICEGGLGEASQVIHCGHATSESYELLAHHRYNAVYVAWAGGTIARKAIPVEACPAARKGSA
jgi:hypothetical protein